MWKKAAEFVEIHPYLALILLALAVLSLLYGMTRGDKAPVSELDSPEEDDKPDMTLIKILDREGKVIEEVTVETDSINYNDGSGSYVSYDNADGKNVVFLLGTYSVKMTDL